MKRAGIPVTRSNIMLFVSSVLILIMAAAYFYAIRDQFEMFRSVNTSVVPYLIALSVLLIMSAGVTNAVLLFLMGYRLTLLEIGTLSILTTFFNYLGPLRVGAAIRATYLKKSQAMPLSSYAGVMAANTLFIIFTSGLLCALMIPHFYSIDPGYLKYIMTLGAAFILIPLLVYVLRPRIDNPRNRLTNMLSLALEALDILSRSRIGIAAVILTIIVQYVIGSILILLSYNTFSIAPDYLSCLAIGVFQSISSFVTLTPNNLGLTEFTTAFIGQITRLGFNQSLIVAGVLRLSNIVVVFGLAPVCWFWLLKKKNYSVKTIPNDNYLNKEDHLK